MTLVTSYIVHAVSDGNYAKGMNHVVGGHVVQIIEVVYITLVTETTSLLSLSMLLNSSLGVG
jgi:sporulation-control protein spo0M